jgi:hypothetical protein
LNIAINSHTYVPEPQLMSFNKTQFSGNSLRTRSFEGMES